MFVSILIPSSRYPRIDENNLDVFSARACFQFADAQGSDFPKIAFTKIDFVGFSLYNLSNAVAPESRIMVLGGPCHFRYP